MSFNLQKCEFLRITNKKYPIFSQYLIQNKIIREVTYAKYLGVTINQNLKWSERVKQITNKANSVHGFLRRNLYSCPMSTKINCYKALVKPVLDYAATVWSPYTQKDIDMVEQVQRRAARFIFNNYSRLASVSEMLTDLNWATLTHSRKEQKAVMLYKIVHHLVDIPASNYLTPTTTSDITRGHHKRFLQPSSTVNAYLYSFFPSSIKIWNCLPHNIVDSNNINQFKQNIAGLATI